MRKTNLNELLSFPCVHNYTLFEDGTIFKNIADAYTNDGKIYQIPTSFKYPILLGNKEDIDSVSDLNSLVELTKKLSTQTDKRIFENYFTPRSLVYLLYHSYLLINLFLYMILQLIHLKLRHLDHFQPLFLYLKF